LQSEKGEVEVRREQALATARDRIDELEAERIEALERMARAEENAAVAEKALEETEDRRTALKVSIGRLEAEKEQLSRELHERDRDIHSMRQAAEIASVGELKGELDDLKMLVRGLADKPSGADEATVRALMTQLSEREGVQTAAMEERFSLQMERTLDEVTRSLRLATASPIDVQVEATDVLVDRLFDQEAEMQTNLGVLAVEERTSKRDIAANLARLREAQKSAVETGD